MAEFYVETIAQENGDHLVHNANCSLLPAKDIIKYLGAISNSGSALKKANEFFKMSTGCTQCIKA
jgi:hypothetical protein